MQSVPDSIMAVEPPDRPVLRSAAAAVAWASQIPDFGHRDELFVLYLDRHHRLRRAAWLDMDFDELYSWPDYLLGYAPVRHTDAVMLLVCRPGDGTEVFPADDETFEIARLAHAARDVPLIDVVLVDGPEWRSLVDVEPSPRDEGAP